jgi:type I restriction enzyme R subunit
VPSPEELARKNIDALLESAGWHVQDYARLNLGASLGVAVREFPLRTGFADYLLLADRKAIGAIEAKPEGTTLTGVEHQSGKYSEGVPDVPPSWRRPLPFLYESTAIETFFTNGLDPDPRSRRVFGFHRPETLLEWVKLPNTLRRRLRQLPPLIDPKLWPAQVEAITNLELSLAEDRPRALIQMASGSGKTFTAVSSIYRLVKFANARRVLFLVDRSNLGRQTLKEFQQYITPDDGRKFTELYNVLHLQSNAFDPVSRVCITTIQRLYSMLSGEAEFDPENEEASLFATGALLQDQPEKAVRYNPTLPIEAFDILITDECHRSIYNLWRQVLEYFDTFIIGLTATPSKQTFGFFNQNLVMEYPRQRAVADGVNVDGQVYRIGTEITEGGATVDAGFYVDRRDKLTRQRRWEQLDEDLTYTGTQLDRDVVSESQIRTVIGTFRDRLSTEIFPGRTDVPKTLIFAKDDSHAEDIVRIVREEFRKGNEFCQKITYRVTGTLPETLIASFRNSYFPRIAVTVDMIATGTDIKPLEVLLFMRPVQSRVLFDQMVGRATRVISSTDLQAVTPDARQKTHFVIVDAVGVVEAEKIDTQTLERKASVRFDRLIDAVAQGAHDEDSLSSLAGRLARLGRTLSPADAYNVHAASKGRSIHEIVNTLLDALDPDKVLERAGLVEGGPEPMEAELEAARQALVQEAVEPFDNPVLREMLKAIQHRSEQTIDTVTQDHLVAAGPDGRQTDALRASLQSFQDFIRQNRDEILALQLILGRPQQRQQLTYQAIRDLHDRLRQHSPQWTTEDLWSAYAALERDRVHGAGERRVLTDLISLVRHAVQMEDELVPFPEVVRARYEDWLEEQRQAGQEFTPEQRWWLDRIAGHVGVNLRISEGDLGLGEFFNQGGQLRARSAFGADLAFVLDALNQALVA